MVVQFLKTVKIFGAVQACSSIIVVFTKHMVVQFSKTTVKLFGAVQACSSIFVVFTKNVVVQLSITTVKLFGAVPVENRELKHT